MNKALKLVKLSLCLLVVSSCQASQPFYPSYLIGLSNPCDKTAILTVFFDPKHQYISEVKPKNKTSRLNLSMKRELLDSLGTDFTATVSIEDQSVQYTEKQVKKYFYLMHDDQVDTTHWQLDAGELCGKDLMERKQIHFKAISKETK